MSPRLVRPRFTRRLPAVVPQVVVLGLLPLALTACGASVDAETYQARQVANGSNATVGDIAVRNISVQPPRNEDGVFEAGDAALVTFTASNDSAEDDELVEASSPAAASVQLVVADRTGAARPVSSIEVPAFESTRGSSGLVLERLTAEVRTGEYVEVTLRFARAGRITVQVPVALTGEYDEDRERSENFHPIGEEEH